MIYRGDRKPRLKIWQHEGTFYAFKKVADADMFHKKLDVKVYRADIHQLPTEGAAIQ
jgi:hypothetical protein